MGNIKETVYKYIKNLSLYIEKENYEESERLYKKYKDELTKYKDEEAKQIILILTEYLKDILNIDIYYYLTNLNTKDKINLLFNEVFEGILINSIIFKETDVKTEKDIKKQIDKIEKVYRKVILNSSIFNLEEKLANLYFLLADMEFQNFSKENKFSVIIFDEIIKNIDEAIFKSKNTTNKEQIEYYKKYRNQILNIKNKLEGQEHLKKHNYEKALDCFKTMNIFENIEEENNIKNFIGQCSFLISFDYEEKKDYSKAIEYLNNLNQDDSTVKIRKKELEWKIEYDKIEKHLINCEFYEAIDNYYKILEDEIDDKLKINLNYAFEHYYISFLSLLSKIALFSYKNKTINDFILKLNNKNFKDQKIVKSLNDLTSFLKLVSNDYNLLSFDKISDSIKKEENINEIKQRIYLKFLIEYYYSSLNKKNVLDLLNNSNINLLLISEENKNSLNNSLKIEDDIDILYLFSNIYEKICKKGIDNSFLLFKIIAQKLLKFCNQRVDNPTKIYVETTKNFIKIFKNILLKSNYMFEEPKILFKRLLFKFPEVKIEAIDFLCFISLKNINVKLDQDILTILIDFLFSFKNDEILNIEEKKNDILNTIIEQLKREKLINKEIIFLLFKLLLYFGENENKEKKSQNKIIQYFLDINIQEEILTSKNVIKSINDYLELGNYSKNIIKIIEKIPKEFISLNMKSALNEDKKNKNIKKKNNKNYVTKNKDKYQLIIEIKTSSILNQSQQFDCESRLEDPEIYKQYLLSLKKQKDLFKTMNLEIISKKINSNNLELFYLICEKKKEWPNNALCSLLNGFYQNDKNLIKETFKLFNLIEHYQKLPEIINKNIEIEKKLLEEGNYHLKNDDIIIYEVMINNFNDLKGFCEHHKSFIDQIKRLNINEKSNVYNDLINLLANKNFDIGKAAFIRAIHKISIFKFIDIYAKILSDPLINEYYKMITLKRLDHELHSKEITSEKIYSITFQLKYFIEWIQIPPIIIETFLFILKNYYTNEAIRKEIIFSFGNYFSILKKEQKDLFIQFNELIKNDSKYQIIKENKFCNTIEYNEYIFYIYSCFQYYDNLDLNEIETIPIQVISRFIFENQKENSLKTVFERIKKYIDDNNYDLFYPPRDTKLRQLFFLPYSKSLDYLEVLK